MDWVEKKMAKCEANYDMGYSTSLRRAEPAKDFERENKALRAALKDMVSLIDAYPRYFEKQEVNMLTYLKAARKALNQTQGE